MNKKETFTRLSILFAGLVIAQLGAAILILSGFGADPFNVLVQGLYRSVATENLSFLTYGCVHILVSAFLTLGLFLINRNLVKSGTLLCMFLGGPLIDLFSAILTPVYEHYTEASYIYLMFIAGFILLAYGIALMTQSKAGNAPNDLMAAAFTKPQKKNPFYITLAVHLVFAFIGFLLGGTIGVGTLLCLAGITPMTEYFGTNMEKKVNSYIKEKLSKK